MTTATRDPIETQAKLNLKEAHKRLYDARTALKSVRAFVDDDELIGEITEFVNNTIDLAMWRIEADIRRRNAQP